MQSFSHLVLID